MNPPDGWHAANQAYLAAAIAVVRARFEARAGRPEATERSAAAERDAEAAERAMPALPALERVTRVFGLSPFEREVLLLCVGVELDSEFTRDWPDGRRGAPTFGLALAVLPDAHWSAVAPSGSLRYFRLVELAGGDSVTTSPLRIDERVLHFLTGVQHLDERLAAFVEPVAASAGALVPSHQAVAKRVIAALERAPSVRPAIQLVGVPGVGRRSIAEAVAATAGRTMLALGVLSLSGQDEASLARLLVREMALADVALLVDCDDLEPSDAARRRIVGRLLDRLDGLVFVISRDPMRLGRRATLTFEIGKPTPAEQRGLWRAGLDGSADPTALDGPLDTMAAQFDLGAEAIETACASARHDGPVAADNGALVRSLRTACLLHMRPRLEGLAQRVEPSARWADIILPEAQREVLREVAMHVRQRARVYGEWDFASKGARGQGVTALFAGASGTGKTMAAEVLARELGFDLYRVDLSQVVSKFIGETEKNLRRIFDVAEEGATVLLFDEADALFGKRSEVKDSHDRFANIEVSYLLQRVETFRGLVVLTTNLKSALDTAFLRRIRFVLQFPFPNATQRAAIWRTVFPAATPTDGLDLDVLARMAVAGGNIRNIALNAAFLAAEDAEPVRMKHIERAAQTEYAKLERPLTTAERG